MQDCSARTLALARRVRAVRKGVTSNISSPGRRLTRMERILLGRLSTGEEEEEEMQIHPATSLGAISSQLNVTVPEPSTVLLAFSVLSLYGDSIRE